MGIILAIGLIVGGVFGAGKHEKVFHGERARCLVATYKFERHAAMQDMLDQADKVHEINKKLEDLKAGK